MSLKAERVTPRITYHGEGPVWSPQLGGLRLVDMMAGDVLTLAADGSVTRRHVGSIAAAVRPRTGGGAVIGVERGFVLEEADGTLTPLGDLWSGDKLRMNEGGCDPDGRFWCGSMGYDQSPGAGTLYRLDADRSVVPVLEGVTVSNGLEWSPDGRLAYYNDTATHEISVFDYDREAGLVDRRRFVRLGDDDSPDGLTVDAEGGVWTAMYDGGAVHRYTPDGTLDAVVEVPTPKVTACTFGGDGLRELFITTSWEHLGPDDEPLAGSVFRVEPGVAGRPVRPFAG
jgi:sugar lactone lactonase YvrE